MRELRSILALNLHPLLRSVAGMFAAVAVFVATTLAASPEAHEHVHADSQDADHQCAITLAADGFCDTSTPPPAAARCERFVDLIAAPVTTHVWLTPGYWHLPAQAPPFRG